MVKPTLRNWLSEGPYTLALSSSFFGFFAHCGVATALFEQGFRPARITGSSAGALVGGALASGMKPEEVRELVFGIQREDFWDPGIGFGYLRGKKFLGLLEENFVSSFAEAKIPFAAAAFDLLRWRTHFLAEGSLPRAVVASCAVPLLFQPVRIGARLYIDGGVFHKSGLQLSNPRERILCIYIQSNRLMDSYEKGRGFVRLEKAQRVVRFQQLPNVDYNSLGTGRKAYAAAYKRSLKALDQPLAGMITEA